MNIRAVEHRTESRSVQALLTIQDGTATGGQSIVIGVSSMRANDDPWPPPTVYLPPNISLTERQWMNISEMIGLLFDAYAKKFEKVIDGSVVVPQVTEGR